MVFFDDNPVERELIKSKLPEVSVIDVSNNPLYFEEQIQKIDLSLYQDKSVVIKGCSNNKVPMSTYYNLCSKLLPIAKSIMYGEACSSVPVFKKRS